MLKKIKSFLLENKNLKQTVLKNTFWLGFGNIAGRLIRAIIIIYAARILGTEGYGVFSYALSLAMLFTIATDLGINGILTRETAKKPEEKNQYFSTALIIKLILIILNIALIMALVPLITTIKEVLVIMPVIIFLIIFDTIREFGFAFFRALEKMEIEAGIFILTNIAISFLGITALLISKNTLALSISYTIGSGIGTATTIWILRNQFKNLFKNFSKKLIVPILNAAWPFAMLGFLAAVMVNIDTIMVGALKTAHDVGLYAAAQKPIQLLYVPASLLATSFFPVFSKLTGMPDKTKMKTAIEKALTASFLMAIPMTIGGVILSKELINFLFGAEYGSSVLTLQILILTVIFVYPGTIIGNIIFAHNKQKIFIGSVAIGAGGNTILNFLLIPIYGIAGAAIATLIIQIINNSFLWLMTKKINDFHVLKKLVKIIIAALMMGILTIVLKIIGVNFLINIALSAIFYLGTLYYVKEELIIYVKGIIKFN
ncbi:MAG: flippase [Patescibacteria group bacterium]